MPASRSVVSMLLTELGDFLYTLKAGPAGGRLRRPSSRRQRHHGHRVPASPSTSGATRPRRRTEDGPSPPAARRTVAWTGPSGGTESGVADEQPVRPWLRPLREDRPSRCDQRLRRSRAIDRFLSCYLHQGWDLEPVTRPRRRAPESPVAAATADDRPVD
jgi:hypothetical protein